MKFALFLAQGFEEGEAVITTDILRRANIIVDLISITNDLNITSSHKIIVKSDKLISDIKYSDYQGFILPGGKAGVDNLMKCEQLKTWLIDANKDNKVIAAICAAPQILGYLGILDGREATSYPGCVAGMEKAMYNDKIATINDGNIITGASVGSSINFALKIVDLVFGADKAFSLENELVIRN